MAIPVARVHLAVAHAALPALLPTPPKLKMMLPPLLPTPPCSCIAAAAILQNPKPFIPLAKPTTSRGRADSDERWDARKTTKPATTTTSRSSTESSSASSSSSPARSIRSAAGRGSSRGRNATPPPPPPKPAGRADAVERWDAHKKPGISASSSSSSSGTSSLATSSNSKSPIIRASSSAVERWDVHKKLRRPTTQAEPLEDSENSSATGTVSSSSSSSDIDMEEEEEEEIVWKPRAMYAGPGFVVAAPASSLLPMPTAFLVPVG